jgi:hypothetical protein
MGLRISSLAIMLMGLLTLPAVGTAGGRDPDGSRMLARRHVFGSVQTDRLSPPGDVVDWRYFRVSELKEVTVLATFEPSVDSVKVSLIGSTGKSVSDVDGVDGKAEIRLSLEPGVYFVKITSSHSITYHVSVR